MSKTKVLLFYDYFSPAYKAGGPIQSCSNLVKYLAPEYDFFVITSNHDIGETTALPGIDSDQWNDFQASARVYYISKKKLGLASLANLMREIQPDVVYINGLFSFWFMVVPLCLTRFQGIKCVIAPRGMFQSSALNVKPVKKKLFLLAMKWMVSQNMVYHATDNTEVEDVKQRMGSNVQVYLANNIPGIHSINATDRIKKANELSLVTVALISPMKNILFVIKCLHELSVPVCYDIIGPIKDETYWHSCQEAIQALPSHVRVTHRGAIPPNEISTELKRYHFFVLPSLGENFGHVIYESLQAGVPVVISDRTPWKELHQKKCGWNLSLESPVAWTILFKALYEMNEEQYQQYSRNAVNEAFSYIKESDFFAQYGKLFK